jgi:hypothetical protein
MFKNLTKKQIIIIVVVAVLVISLIIFLVAKNKKKKKKEQEERLIRENQERMELENAKPVRKSQVVPKEDLEDEDNLIKEKVSSNVETKKVETKPIEKPKPVQPQAQPQQPKQPTKKEVPFTPIMKEDMELYEQLNNQEPGISIGD